MHQHSKGLANWRGNFKIAASGNSMQIDEIDLEFANVANDKKMT